MLDFQEHSLKKKVQILKYREQMVTITFLVFYEFKMFYIKSEFMKIQK